MHARNAFAEYASGKLAELKLLQKTILYYYFTKCKNRVPYSSTNSHFEYLIWIQTKMANKFRKRHKLFDWFHVGAMTLIAYEVKKKEEFRRTILYVQYVNVIAQPTSQRTQIKHFYFSEKRFPKERFGYLFD
jgi:hypothetical protein